MLKTNVLRLLLVGGLLFCVNAEPLVRALAGGGGVQSTGESLTVTVSFAPENPLTPDETFELRLNRAVQKSEGRLAILLDRTDITGLFTVGGDSLTYNGKLFALPVGESALTVYLVSPSEEWKEAARFTLRVVKEKTAEKVAAPVAETTTAKASEKVEKKDEENPVAAADKAQEKTTENSAAKSGEKPGEKAGEKTAEKAEGKEEEKAAQNSTAADAAQTASTEQATTEQAATEQASTEQAATETQKKIAGFEKLDVTPALTISMKSQAAESHFPEENRPERPTFADFTMQGSIRNELTRGFFNSQTQFDLAGSSFRKEALRFGQLGNRAPLIDLASYLMQFQAGRAKFIVGHTSYGSSRHIISGFSSRGMTLTLPLNKPFDFSLAAMNGTAVVGTENFFGLRQRKHQMLSGTLGAELLPARPGGVRLEISYLNGYLLPVSSFTEGAVNDAERSRGVGLRFVASDPTQRFRFEGGFSRSQFFNPDDALLSQGDNLTPIPTVTRNARYVETGVDILKDRAVTANRKMNLTLTFRHETVDPLYRSLAASTQADKTQNQFEVNWALGDITAQVSHLRFNDNLAGIPSILQSLNRASRVAFAAPLVSLIGDPAKPNAFLPRVSYSFDRGRQFSEAIPINGGFEFAPDAIPDQIGTNQSLGFEWQFTRLRLGYRVNHSLQNNRQLGRELADLLNLTNAVSVGIVTIAALDLNFELGFDSAKNIETGRIDRTLRLSPNVTWRMNPRATLTSSFSTTLAGDAAKTTRNRNHEFDLQWAYQFAAGKEGFKKLQSQAFVRYANRFASSRDNVFNLNNLTKTQTVNIGLSFTFF